MLTRHITWARVPTHIPSTSQQEILAPRENSSIGDESEEDHAPSPAVKSRPTSSKDDESGGEDHSGGDITDDVFVYDDVDVGDGLDGLDGTLQKTEEHRQRYQAPLRAFNAKRANRQGSVVETSPGGVSNAPSGGGEGDSSLHFSNGEGGSGGSDSVNNTVGSGNESASTSPSSRTEALNHLSNRRRYSPCRPILHPRQIAGRELPRRYFPGGIGATLNG